MTTRMVNSEERTLTMTELRGEPGERLRDVWKEGHSFTITKAGKPVARLVPLSQGFDFAALQQLRTGSGY